MLKEFFDKLTFTPDPIRLFSAGISDVGQRRDHNEDNFLIDEKLGLFMVADGMGGHEAGEVASKLAIETIFNHIKKIEKSKEQRTTSETIKKHLQDAIEDANNQTHCYNIAKGQSEGRGMGTTITGFLSSTSISPKEKKLHTFNVGDSRIYSFYEGKLSQLSTDHSHYQLWIDTGKEGPEPKQNIIYKAIGPWQRILAEQHTLPIRADEIFLLCSDGLSDMLSDKEIRKILSDTQIKKLQDKAQALIDAANTAGGKDNITVILVKP
ncbi:MAG: serine/threonine-protein phosphatase [Gammaproteobacteria bacterium]|nr:serine/threonine-protein phosphatase [Gammaproteobacteria bacterium]